jgi:hypothetical protein
VVEIPPLYPSAIACASAKTAFAVSVARSHHSWAPLNRCRAADFMGSRLA